MCRFRKQVSSISGAVFICDLATVEPSKKIGVVKQYWFRWYTVLKQSLQHFRYEFVMLLKIRAWDQSERIKGSQA